MYDRIILYDRVVDNIRICSKAGLHFRVKSLRCTIEIIPLDGLLFSDCTMVTSICKGSTRCREQIHRPEPQRVIYSPRCNFSFLRWSCYIIHERPERGLRSIKSSLFNRRWKFYSRRFINFLPEIFFLSHPPSLSPRLLSHVLSGTKSFIKL